MGTITILTPEGVRSEAVARLAPRHRDLAGLRVGLIDNDKPGGRSLLEGVASVLDERGVKQFHWTKKRASTPHPDLESLSLDVDVVVGALGD